MTMRRRSSLSLLLTISVGASAAAFYAGCGSSSDDTSTFVPDSGTAPGDDSGGGSFDSGGGFGGDGATGPHSDFPATPVIDTPDGGVGAPANAPALFGGATASDAGDDAPCLIESEVGSLLPKNWLRPRFTWLAGGGENLFEIRVHADNQVNDLVVYTTATTWTMPATMWKALAANSAGVPMTVSVRGAVFDGTNVTSMSQGSTGPFGIAPAEAPGAIVYWHIIGSGQGDLKGFNAGDEGVETALAPSNVKQYSTQCVGCHTSTPDGKYAVFSSDSVGYRDGIGSVETATQGNLPPFLSPGGRDALQNVAHGIMTTSGAHWAANDYMVVTTNQADNALTWLSLDAPDGGVTGSIATTGDPNASHVAPNWSHDGKNIVYTSAPGSGDGRPSGSGNDVWTVPYNNRAGGTARAMANINTAANEYYPVYSPDDQWVAFNRTTQGDTYAQSGAEVFVAKADGAGTAQRLAANDPPACQKTRVSPGVQNSWPKFAPAKPTPTTVGGLTYYWVVFSSVRYDGATPQLYMAPVVIDAAGNLQQYKAVYLWNQPATEHNHTPAWDVFSIPPAGPPR